MSNFLKSAGHLPHVVIKLQGEKKCVVRSDRGLLKRTYFKNMQDIDRLEGIKINTVYNFKSVKYFKLLS